MKIGVVHTPSQVPENRAEEQINFVKNRESSIADHNYQPYYYLNIGQTYYIHGPKTSGQFRHKSTHEYYSATAEKMLKYGANNYPDKDAVIKVTDCGVEVRFSAPSLGAKVNNILGKLFNRLFGG